MLSNLHRSSLIKDDYQDDGETLNVIVTLEGLTVGNDQVYGTVTGTMLFDSRAWDQDQDYYYPASVTSFTLEDHNEQPFKCSNEVLLYAMQAAYDRFWQYFDHSNVKEI